MWRRIGNEFGNRRGKVPYRIYGLSEVWCRCLCDAGKDRIRRTGKAFNAVVDNIDVAIKNEDGDITNIVELKSKIVKYI